MSFTNLGYRFTTEAEAIVARKQAADHYGIPVSQDAVTQYYANYKISPSGDYYFEAEEGLTPVFGEAQDISSLFTSGSI